MSMSTPTEPEIGSRWYVWGDHVEVVEVFTPAGDEPFVRIKRRGDTKPLLPAVLKAFARRAVPSEKGWN